MSELENDKSLNDLSLKKVLIRLASYVREIFATRSFVHGSPLVGSGLMIYLKSAAKNVKADIPLDGRCLTLHLDQTAFLTAPAVLTQEWSQGRIFPGVVSIEGESEALYTTQNWDEDSYDTIWTDGSRLDSSRVGAACAWQTEQEVWTGKRFFLGDNKEVFDAGVFAILQALKVFDERRQSGREYTIFSNYQPAIQRARSDQPGPGQCDGGVLGVPGRPSARADPGWAVGGVAVAAGSNPGWVEDCGCAVPDSARRARRRADSRTVTFSMETVAQCGGDETGSWEKHKMSRAGQATEESNDYIHGRCARQEPRPHTRLPTRTNPQPSARPTLVPRTGHHSVLVITCVRARARARARASAVTVAWSYRHRYIPQL